MIGPVYPPDNILIDLLPMTDAEDSDLVPDYLEHDAIVADAKFPVTLQSLSERNSKLLGNLCEA